MEAIARTRNLKGSPQKARLVIDMIRGRNVSQALAILQFTNKRAAKPIAKCLRSAIANATYKAEQKNIAIDPDDLWISKCFVDMGVHKNRRRLRPAPQGRAYQEQRHYCHITIEVTSDTPEAAVVKLKKVGNLVDFEDIARKEEASKKKEKSKPEKAKEEEAEVVEEAPKEEKVEVAEETSNEDKADSVEEAPEEKAEEKAEVESVEENKEEAPAEEESETTDEASTEDSGTDENGEDSGEDEKEDSDK